MNSSDRSTQSEKAFKVAKPPKPLNDTFIRAVKHSGKPAGDKFGDAEGMYLLVKAAGKYWRMDYTFEGKRKTLAVGVYPAVGLAKARARRLAARELLAEGIDPSAAKQSEKRAKQDAAKQTFEAVAWEWFKKDDANRAETTRIKLKAWLLNDVLPYIGKTPIAKIRPVDIREKVLDNVINRGAFESAQRIKNLCSRIFNFAVSKGIAPADVTSSLGETLPSRRAKNHAAITDPKEAGALMRAIYGYEAHPLTVAALKLSAMVFVRPGELRTAEWSEFDLAAETWTIPAAKMKMRRDHVVPLAKQAVALLEAVRPYTGHARYVFSSLRTGSRPMSENTINSALRAMGFAKETHCAHGFRAMARTIMDEVMGERLDLIEHQLAHAVKDATGRAYNRTAHLPARKEMMQRWADYLDRMRTGAEVIHLHGAA